jgi:hypothetical protein
MNFPHDHFSHTESGLEWWYLWGRLNDGRFFHFCNFKIALGQMRHETFCTIHSSISDPQVHYFDVQDDEIEGMKASMLYRNPFFICKNKQMELEARPMSEPIVWEINGRNYYSIPRMQICLKENGNFVLGEGWFDHERYERIWDLAAGKNWEWLALKLYNGVNIMCYRLRENSYAAVEYNGKVYEGAIRESMDGIFTLSNLPTPLMVRPLVEERIFRPKIGIKYSEQPLMVFCNDQEVGYGMREKTYGGERVDESKVINSELIRS